ncbi:MAG: polysaccharide biosynthesis protein, partial [Clostridiales bacterium]|nr:polysaccharide biosynthesis protein [Clostridiales bacterium]
MSATTKKSIMQGTAILAVVGIICKLIGVFFRIPLTKMVGDSGMAIYEAVYPTYSLLLTISSAGIPVAVSRMVSHCVNRNDPRNAKRIFQVALTSLAILGFAAMAIMVVFRGTLSWWVKDGAGEATLGFVMIAPSVLIVCVMSAFRGFLQGQQKMAPTAMSQLIEQVAKVSISLPLASLGMKMGPQIGLPPYAAGATFALLGISIGEGFALVYMGYKFYQNRKEFARIEQNPEEEPLTAKLIAWRLFVVALPITAGACIVPLSSFIDSGMIRGLLMQAGFSHDFARDTYGRYAGIVITYINVPTALAIAVTMATVPAISAGVSRKDYAYVKEQSHLGLRYAFIIGLPCAVGMSLLAEPLIRLFFNNENVWQTANMLRLSAFTIIFFTVVQTTSSILQGLRKQRIPMYTLMAGVVVKIVL